MVRGAPITHPHQDAGMRTLPCPRPPASGYCLSLPPRFESLEPEMNSQASRVAVVNQIARQLMHSGHPSEKDIKAQQDKLNTRCERDRSTMQVTVPAGPDTGICSQQSCAWWGRYFRVTI